MTHPHLPCGPRARSAVMSCAAALACGLALGAHAQDSTSPPPPQAPKVAAAQSYTDAQLAQLLGPIALYPDTLLANTLTASLYPDQIAQAALLCAGGAPTQAQIDATGWEAPVKAIASVPDVVQNLAKYPDWTKALGAAYLKQPADVMRVVQSLRAKAKANGTLVSTDQQQVTSTQNDDGSGETIEITSTNPQVVYVPVYSPDVVYADPAAYYGGVPVGAIAYSNPWYVGPAYGAIGCDWYHGYCAWGGAIYNPAWDHVRLDNVNTLHGQWNAAHAAAVTPGGVVAGPAGPIGYGGWGRAGDVGNPYRPAAAAARTPGEVGTPRMPDAAGMPRGGLGALGTGTRTDGAVRSATPWGASGGWGAPGNPQSRGVDRYGSQNSAFNGDRGTYAASTRGASSYQRSGARGGDARNAGGGGRR